MNNKLKIGILGFVICCSVSSAIPPKWKESEWRKFLNAIKQVETGSKSGIGIRGDYDKRTKTFKALGPYQIHRVCWIDAVKYDKSILLHDYSFNFGTFNYAPGLNYEYTLISKSYSEKVLRSYISRYLPKNGSFEDAARIWNGGPTGHKKSATLKYAEKFRKYFK